MTRLLLIFGIGVAALAATAYLLHPRFRPPAQEEYEWIHCPNCGLELRYSADMRGKLCPRCQPQPEAMVPTKKSMKEGDPPSPEHDFNVAVAFELAALLAAVVYVLYHPRQPKEDTTFFRIKCRKCKQKIRYAARQAGNAGMCPRCRTRLDFPVKGELDEA
jgi:hypothetical protein